MKPSSAKAKGRRLQQEVRDLLLARFPHLQPDDIKCAIMGESGVDLHLSPAAAVSIPFAIECKNVEKIQIWSALTQAEKNAKGKTPLLVFRRNRSSTYAALPFVVLLSLLNR